MKNLIAEKQDNIDTLAERIKTVKTLKEFRRIACLLMRLTLNCSAEQIALVLGLSTTTVHVMHSRYAKEGDSFFEIAPQSRGNHRYLSEEQEAQLLSSFVEKSEQGKPLTVKEIKLALEKKLGHEISLAGVYKLLKRHGGRKPVPRPRHPKSNPKEQKAK